MSTALVSVVNNLRLSSGAAELTAARREMTVMEKRILINVYIVE